MDIAPAAGTTTRIYLKEPVTAVVTPSEDTVSSLGGDRSRLEVELWTNVVDGSVDDGEWHAVACACVDDAAGRYATTVLPLVTGEFEFTARVRARADGSEERVVWAGGFGGNACVSVQPLPDGAEQTERRDLERLATWLTRVSRYVYLTLSPRSLLRACDSPAAPNCVLEGDAEATDDNPFAAMSRSVTSPSPRAKSAVSAGKDEIAVRSVITQQQCDGPLPLEWMPPRELPSTGAYAIAVVAASVQRTVDCDDEVVAALVQLLAHVPWMHSASNAARILQMSCGGLYVAKCLQKTVEGAALATMREPSRRTGVAAAGPAAVSASRRGTLACDPVFCAQLALRMILRTACAALRVPAAGRSTPRNSRNATDTRRAVLMELVVALCKTAPQQHICRHLVLDAVSHMQAGETSFERIFSGHVIHALFNRASTDAGAAYLAKELERAEKHRMMVASPSSGAAGGAGGSVRCVAADSVGQHGPFILMQHMQREVVTSIAAAVNAYIEAARATLDSAVPPDSVGVSPAVLEYLETGADAVSVGASQNRGSGRRAPSSTPAWAVDVAESDPRRGVVGLSGVGAPLTDGSGASTPRADVRLKRLLSMCVDVAHAACRNEDLNVEDDAVGSTLTHQRPTWVLLARAVARAVTKLSPNSSREYLLAVDAARALASAHPRLAAEMLKLVLQSWPTGNSPHVTLLLRLVGELLAVLSRAGVLTSDSDSGDGAAAARTLSAPRIVRRASAPSTAGEVLRSDAPAAASPAVRLEAVRHKSPHVAGRRGDIGADLGTRKVTPTFGAGKLAGSAAPELSLGAAAVHDTGAGQQRSMAHGGVGASPPRVVGRSRPDSAASDASSVASTTDADSIRKSPAGLRSRPPATSPPRSPGREGRSRSQRARGAGDAATVSRTASSGGAGGGGPRRLRGKRRTASRSPPSTRAQRRHLARTKSMLARMSGEVVQRALRRIALCASDDHQTVATAALQLLHPQFGDALQLYQGATLDMLRAALKRNRSHWCVAVRSGSQALLAHVRRLQFARRDFANGYSDEPRHRVAATLSNRSRTPGAAASQRGGKASPRGAKHRRASALDARRGHARRSTAHPPAPEARAPPAAQQLERSAHASSAGGGGGSTVPASVRPPPVGRTVTA